MQRLEIVARACELIVRPNETPEDGKTTRTIEELMDEVIRRGIVPDISWSSVQRILAGLGASLASEQAREPEEARMAAGLDGRKRHGGSG